MDFSSITPDWILPSTIRTSASFSSGSPLAMDALKVRVRSSGRIVVNRTFPLQRGSPSTFTSGGGRGRSPSRDVRYATSSRLNVESWKVMRKAPVMWS